MTVLQDRIEINPGIMLGKPVIRGTRIPVEMIIRKLSEGATQSEMLDAYPRLTSEDIRAALTFTTDITILRNDLPLGLANGLYLG